MLHSAPALVHVEAQELGQPAVQVLAVVVGVEGAAAVAQPEVQQPVRAEGELAAVVVGERLLDGQQLAAGRGSATPSRTRYSSTRVSPSVFV